MALLAFFVGAIGAAFPSEKPAFVETAAHWYAPRQTMRAAAKLVEKWTGNAELLEQELVKAGWSPPRQLDRSSWMTGMLVMLQKRHHKDVLRQLPKEAARGIAGASGREGRKSVERWRISADEIMRLAAAWRALQSIEIGE